MSEADKTCTECGQTKPLLEFPMRRGTAGSHHSSCFACKGEKGENQHAQRARRYSRSAKGRSTRGAAALMARYGLTRDAFNARLQAQGGKCPLCPPGTEPSAVWTVDHDHACCPTVQTCGGCLRDILCRRHNAALGLFDDDPVLLRAAADYIERWRERIQAAGTTPWQPKGTPSGPEHYNWKGDAASLQALRQRAWRALGTADRCVNGCTGAGRYEWVVPEGADPADVASYVQMCRSCVVAMNGLKGAGHPNAKLSPGQVAEIRARYVRGRAPTQAALAREYGVSQGAMSLVLRGERYVA